LLFNYRGLHPRFLGITPFQGYVDLCVNTIASFFTLLCTKGCTPGFYILRPFRALTIDLFMPVLHGSLFHVPGATPPVCIYYALSGFFGIVIFFKASHNLIFTIFCFRLTFSD
jgi:hypothetical protein